VPLIQTIIGPVQVNEKTALTPDQIRETFNIGAGSVTRLLRNAAPRIAGFAAATAGIGGVLPVNSFTSTRGGIDFSPLINAGVSALSRIGAPRPPAAFAPAAQTVPASELPQFALQTCPPQGTFGNCPQCGTRGRCDCRPKPGPCDPAWIERSDVFGTPSCDDPRYPRLTYSVDANGDPVARCRPARKKPRMNPFNPRAAGRAARRLGGLGRGLKRIKKNVKTADRMLS